MMSLSKNIIELAHSEGKYVQTYGIPMALWVTGIQLPPDGREFTIETWIYHG